MKLIKYFLQRRSVTILLLVLVLAGGLFSYVKMGKLEDAPFTIKQALVLTSYPGASPSEVQSQVTDVLEEAIQSLGELYYLKTENRAGLSKITVYVKKETRADEMQQLWDKLRRKVGDAQSKLPAGAGPSVVNDDFGDVLGVFYGLTSEGRSYRELEDQAKLIKNELLKVKDVARIEIYGTQTPTIEVVVSPAVMSRSGITTADIANAFNAQNKVVDAGGITAGTGRIRIESTGNFYSLDEIRQLTIVSRSGEHFRLGDIADINESYQTPASNLMRIDGKTAVGIAISTVPTGNVVDMAEAIEARIEELKSDMPEGFGLVSIYDQGHESAIANQGFIINLIVSVITVVAILLFFIGFKNGLLIGSGLVFSIFATLIVMLAGGIALQRMSLAAIIIAMGMLVDNAIVVSDSALVNMQRNAETGIHHESMFRNCPPLVGCHGHSDTDIPAYLLFTTYHRRIFILSGYCHRCIAHVQLGICTDTNPVLHPRICTPPAPLGIEWNPLFRQGLRPLPEHITFRHSPSLCHSGVDGYIACRFRLEFQVYPESLCTCSGETLLYIGCMATRRNRHR